MTDIRKEPCSTCPYRKDVPSGVWAAHEYEKLRLYDAPTGSQPFAGFACHVTPDHDCHGWAVVHSNRGHEFELLAFRMRPPTNEVTEAAVPLWSSGNEAADHGQADMEHPSSEARDVAQKLVRKYPRLSGKET